jgi:hypothetical protein
MKEVKSKRAFEFLLYTKNNYKTLEYRKYKEDYLGENCDETHTMYLYYINEKHVGSWNITHKEGWYFENSIKRKYN